MADGISQRLAGLPDSETMAITARAAAMRASGLPVIGFGAGEPDFPTPEHIVEAAREAAGDPLNHRYSPAGGLMELREAVAVTVGEETGNSFGPEKVVITNGAKGAVFGAMMGLLERGDEVLMPGPYWVTHPAAAGLTGAAVKVVPTGPSEGFRVTVDRLEAARTERTKMLVFVSPSNPTGAVYPADEVAEIGEWAARHGIWVMSDDIYRSLVYGSASFTSMPVAVPDMAARCVIVDGVAKTFAMTGWRVGWMIGPADLVDAVARLQSHSTSNVSNIGQRAALAALRGPRDTVEAMRTAFDKRRATMLSMLADIDGVSCVEPEGAFYAFPSVEGLLGRPLGGATPRTSAELADALLEEAQIAVVPGEAFGAPGHIRLSFALGDDDLVEGLSRWQALSG
jgi:aspartate aminotransferase